MNLKQRIEDIVKGHKFFVRKSQHYILGNWSVYVPLRKKMSYYWRYPRAYLKFMWLEIKELG